MARRWIYCAARRAPSRHALSSRSCIRRKIRASRPAAVVGRPVHSPLKPNAFPGRAGGRVGGYMRRRQSQDINSIYNVLELLQGRARSTEALVMVKLDIARNRILTAGLVFSMASTCLTVGALVSGIFGEHLPPHNTPVYSRPRRRPPVYAFGDVCFPSSSRSSCCSGLFRSIRLILAQQKSMVY